MVVETHLSGGSAHARDITHGANVETWADVTCVYCGADLRLLLGMALQDLVLDGAAKPLGRRVVPVQAAGDRVLLLGESTRRCLP